MHKDEIVEETRRLRDEYAKQFNYNLDRIYEDLKRKSALSGRKHVSIADKKMPPKKGKETSKAA